MLTTLSRTGLQFYAFHISEKLTTCSYPGDYEAMEVIGLPVLIDCDSRRVLLKVGEG